MVIRRRFVRQNPLPDSTNPLELEAAARETAISNALAQQSSLRSGLYTTESTLPIPTNWKAHDTQFARLTGPDGFEFQLQETPVAIQTFNRQKEAELFDRGINQVGGKGSMIISPVGDNKQTYAAYREADGTTHIVKHTRVPGNDPFTGEPIEVLDQWVETYLPKTPKEYPSTASGIQGYTDPATEARMLGLAGITPEMVAYPAPKPTIDQLHDAIWADSPSIQPTQRNYYRPLADSGNPRPILRTEVRIAKGIPQPPASVPTWMNQERPDALPPSALLDPVFNNVIDPNTLEVTPAQSALDLIKLKEQNRLQVGADQLRLNLEATAPVPFDYIRQIRDTDQRDIDLSRVTTTPDPYLPGSAPPQYVASTSGPIMVDPHRGEVLYKPDAMYDPSTGEVVYGKNVRLNESMPGVQERTGFWDNVWTGLKTGYGYTTGIEPGKSSNFSMPAFAMALPKYRQELTDRMDIERLAPVGRFAGVVGGVIGDIANFGTQHLTWRMHPMDVYGSELVPRAVESATGLDRHKNKPQLKRYMIPLGVAGGIATHALSNNINFGTILDPDQAGRVEGFRAATSTYENPTEVTSYPGALYQTMMVGNTPYLLPWEQFHRERPDVSYDQYQAYQEYLWGNHDLQILGGLVKATDENIDAPTDAAWYDPRQYEARIAGYRITPLGLVGGLGTLALGTHMIRNNLARQRAANRRRVVVNPNQVATTPQ